MDRRIVISAAVAVLAMFLAVPGAAATGARAGAGCAASSGSAGTIRVCPARAPVGSVVTLSGTGCHGPGSHRVLAVFLGPRAYVGSAGGGVDFTIPVHHGHFRTAFEIPARYRAGGDAGRATPVTPGGGYAFTVYPAAICRVPFTVTGGASVASTGPRLQVAALLGAALVLLVAGSLLAHGGRRREGTPN